MYGDTEVIRRRVAQLREQAGDVRALADLLVARTESSGWSGRAATSMWQRVAERASRLREVAADHDRAADSLDAHLRAAQETAETIAARQRRAEVLVAEARSRLAAHRTGSHVLTGPDQSDQSDRVLAAFEAPASGHLDWLEVELPGLPADS